MTTNEIITWQKTRLKESIFKLRTEEIGRLAEDIAHLEEVLRNIDVGFSEEFYKLEADE